MRTFPTKYRERICEEVAETPDEYLPLLLQIIHSYRRSVALKPAEESFQQGWEEALAGETLPVADLWTGIESEQSDITAAQIRRILGEAD